MIYYKYKVNYVNKLNTNTEVLATRSCEDIEYDTHLQETKLIVQQSVLDSNGNIPTINEEIIFITENEYNQIVLGSDDLEIIEQ